MTVTLPFIFMHEIENCWSMPLSQETQQDSFDFCVTGSPTRKQYSTNDRKRGVPTMAKKNRIGPRNCFYKLLYRIILQVCLICKWRKHGHCLFRWKCSIANFTELPSFFQAWYNTKGYHAAPTFLNILNNVILRSKAAEKGLNASQFGKSLAVLWRTLLFRVTRSDVSHDIPSQICDVQN